MKTKEGDIEVYVSDDNPSNFDTLEGNTSDGRYEYADFPLIDEGLTNRYDANRSDFAMEWEEADSFAEDYKTDENIYSAYLMGNMDFGTINLLAGVRVEHTKLECEGYMVDEDLDEPVLGLDTKENDYTNFLPGVHFRMNLTENTILNAAWTNTISRPLWEQTRYARVTDDDDNVEIGNPDLDPYEAMNWDATLTYYMPSLGLASVGVFYKDIDNFIYAQTLDLETYELTTFNNGESGTIYGVELAYQQNLAFLPSPLDGLSLLGNLTFSDSEADILPTDGEPARTIEFVRNSDMVGSFAVSYEKSGLFLRLSGTYRSAYLDSVGEEALEDEYIDDHFQMDLSTAYTFMDKYTVYANFINLNNEPLKAYFGESGQMRQFEEYGWSARAGVKFKF
jgi:TonB-dependent receptor